VALICDTGPLYAAMDQADQDHELCVELFRTTREPLVVPAPVVVELDWLASSRLGPAPFADFLADVLEGTVRIAELTHVDYVRIRALYAQYADLPLGFVDAAVLAIVERFGENKVATLDYRHFRTIQPRHLDYLILVPDIV
jgi:predicted nucleic acid-binding protein